MRPSFIRLVIPVMCAGSVWVQPLTSTAADIDPFTGQTLAIEQTRAVLELTKAQNSLLEEQTKKARAEFMLRNADRIFAAELRRQLDQASGRAGSGFGGGYPAVRFPGPDPVSRSAKKRTDALTAPIFPAANVVTRPSGSVGPHLIGILQRNDGKQVVVEAAGQVSYVRVGEHASGLGVVESIGTASARIGGRDIGIESLSVDDVDRQDVRMLAGRALNPAGGSGGLPPPAGLNPAVIPSR